MNHDILMRTIKIVDIGYITSIYFIVGYYATILLDKVFDKYFGKIDDKKNTQRLN